MATYDEIYGKRVEVLSSDPTLTSANEGQVWYNSTSGTLKGVVQSAAWSSASPMTLAKAYRFGGGTPTAAFAAGGSPYVATTEEYNGSGWSAGGDIGTPRAQGGSAGTLTAGLIYGGYFNPPASTKNETEEYNGTSWSEQSNLSSARYSQGGFGTQTAAVYTNGYSNPPPSTVADTEEYNGSSWSEGNNSSTLRMDVGTAGTLTAGMIFGGQSPPPAVHANTELYDGTNWTAGPSMNSARSQLGGVGTQTSALAYGGRYLSGPGLRVLTEAYDGTSWSETADLATATRCLSSPKSNTGNSAALAIGGLAPSATAKTEEFNKSVVTTTAGAWASGGNIPTAVNGQIGVGSLTAGLAALGHSTTAAQNTTIEYDGTTWTEGGDANTARNLAGGLGIQTAAIAAGGLAPPNPPFSGVTKSESYNGSSWTEGPTINTGRYGIGGAGIQTAGVIFAGYSEDYPGYITLTEEWDGSSWTESGDLSTARHYVGSIGSQTAAMCLGGSQPPPATAIVEEYNGSTWTSGTALMAATQQIRASGNASLALAYSGYNTTYAAQSYLWNDTAWITQPSLATGRNECAGCASGSSSTAAFACGGEIPARTNTTENFTAGTTSIDPKTLTTS